MKLIFGHDLEIAQWVGKRIDVEDFGPCTAIGIALNGEIVAGVVYNRYSKTNIEMSIASTTPRWATKNNLKIFFNYPFKQLNLGRITATTRASNSHTRDFLKRLGYIKEGVIREGYGDEDAIVYGLLKRECRWIKDE